MKMTESHFVPTSITTLNATPEDSSSGTHFKRHTYGNFSILCEDATEMGDGSGQIKQNRTPTAATARGRGANDHDNNLNVQAVMHMFPSP